MYANPNRHDELRTLAPNRKNLSGSHPVPPRTGPLQWVLLSFAIAAPTVVLGFAIATALDRPPTAAELSEARTAAFEECRESARYTDDRAQVHFDPGATAQCMKDHGWDLAGMPHS